MMGLSKLIREDSIQDFIIYVNINCISRNAIIKQSIFETNSFLMKNEIDLIKYAAFFGSIQIFTFLKNEKVALTPSLFYYEIHSKNAELIHLLEDNLVKRTAKVSSNTIKIECLKESMKCNHNDIADYFLNNYLQREDENSDHYIIQSLIYYSFSFLRNDHLKESFFYLY